LRVLELLEDKREAFDEYARRSDMANAVPDAVDTSSEANCGTRSWRRSASVSRQRDPQIRGRSPQARTTSVCWQK